MNFQAVPIIRVSDIDEAMEFYLGKLAMSVVWKHQRDDQSPLYMQIMREDLVFQLSQFPQHGEFGSMLFINTDSLDAVHSELGQNGFQCPEIEIAPWGTRAFEIQDPFSNQFLFNESK